MILYWDERYLDMGKISYNKIKKYIEIESKSGCKLITSQDEYINTHQKIRIMCSCGNEFKTSYHIFTRKTNPKKQCNECGLKNRIKKRTIPLEKLQEEINKKFNYEFQIVGEYKNRSSHTKFKHKICGYEWETTPINFLRDGGCPKCNKRRSNITTESFKKEVYELTNGEYELIGEYTKAVKKTIFKHNVCNRLYESTPHDFLSGCRCPMCWNESKLGKLQKDTVQLIKEVKEKYEDEYTIIGEYLGARIKTEVRHNKCDNLFKITPDNLLRGKGCPYCFESKGEKRIGKYLKNNNIEYLSQFKITECKNINPLPFDFAIFNNTNLISLIEYDGKQHFEVVPGWGGKKMFDELIKRDNIKNQYCTKNKIKLIRIPYWEFDNIESILEKELKK